MSRNIDFMGIGAAKCGTSKIAQLLSAHPEVCLSEPKDIQYFNKKASYVFEDGNPNFGKSTEWYFKHFNHCKTDSIRGEFSTTYIYCEEAPAIIAKHFPEIKLLAAIRHPAERAYSHYLMLNQFQQKENRPFDLVINQEKEYIEKGLYAKQLKRFYDHFPKEQILVIRNEALRNQAGETTKRLYNFIGIDPNFVPENISSNFNSAKKMRSPGLSKAYGRIMEKMIDWGMSDVINTLRKTGIKKVYDRFNYQSIEVPKMSPEAYNFIMDKSRKDIEELEVLLDIDLSGWR